MAKVQKTVLLPRELQLAIEEEERRTGVSFARIIAAAIVQWCYRDPFGPHDVWMRMAVGLEKGEVKPEQVAERCSEIIVLQEREKVREANLTGAHEGERLYRKACFEVAQMNYNIFQARAGKELAMGPPMPADLGTESPPGGEPDTPDQ